MKKLVLFSGLGLLLLLAVLVFFNIDFKTNKTASSPIVKKEEIIKLRMGHNLPINSALHEASLLFAEKVKAKTKNRVQIDIFPAQKLGNDHSMAEMARIGKIDILLTPTAKMSVPVPSMQYADLPFLFPTRDDAYELLDGEPGEMILKELDSIDLFGVAFWENGFKHFTGNKPLLCPEDFKDKKFRVMKSRIIMEQFKALGAEPVPIDFHATKKALKDRVVDGQENPLVAIVNMGFHEVQTDLTISEHAYLAYVFSISKKTLEKLPADIGDILVQTAKEVTTWERVETQKREEIFLDTVRKAGVNIHVLTKEEKERFADATKNIIKIYEDVIGSHIISKTEELLSKKYSNEDDVFIGLDADLSMGERDAGLAIKRGIELAIDEINSGGGLLGKKVRLIAKDHKTISTQGEKNIKDLISDSRIIAIIGGKHSAVVSSEIKHIQQAKIPFVSPWAAASNITENGYDENYIFRVSLNDRYAVDFLLKETLKKHSRPAIVVENSIWGRGGLELLQARLKSKGLKVPQGIVINRGTDAFGKVINEIKKQKADSIIMIVNSVDGSHFIENMGKQGYYLPTISHWGVVGGDFFERNKKYLKNIDLRFIQTFSFLDTHNEVAKKLATDYIKKYNKSSIKDIAASVGVAQAYDAMHLIALGVNNAGSFEGPQIKKALENISTYKGALKMYDKPFDQTDHEALDVNDMFMSRFSDEGQIVSISPRESKL